MNFIKHIIKKKTIKIIDEKKNTIDLESLKKIINYNSKFINSLDINNKNTIVIVLDNGPDFITSFLSNINVCISAPLNPNYTTAEFNFYIKDLMPKALITNFNEDHPALKVAKKNKIKIINVKNLYFKTEKNKISNKTIKINSSNIEDIALILHTSGTTSKPKMVALTHNNLLNSAKNISTTLKLTTKDKNIILMPSFHIHGIIASILAPLYKGGKVVALPKFNVLSFYNFLDIHSPSWFTAVPTMLQSIIDRSKNNLKIVKKNKLRFIRSSSASLPKNTLKELESLFRIPVIESYGMTEATHQMTTNLLPPFKRKVGSVGVPIGLEVKIINNNLNFIKKTEEGEIVIKGGSVLKKYLANDKANSSSFIDGWFRTGDLGYFDKDGHLFISGRIKEIINRGGEKVSPKEIDDVFSKHPKISKVVAFAVKHDKLGEDVAIAVVLNKGKKCTSSELKDFVKNKLAQFKIPKKIYFLNEIPIGATGKIQRIGLAKKLGIEK